MALVSRSVYLCFYFSRNSRIPARIPSPSSYWKTCSTSVAQHSPAEATEADVTKASMEQIPEPVESRREFVQRVKKDTRTQLDKFDYRRKYKKLHRRLSNNNMVKATDINIMLYNTKKLYLLDDMKALLRLFRLSPSFKRDSVSSVALSTCLRLGAPLDALEIISDPVRYGIFPGKHSLHRLMDIFSKKGDVESFERVCAVRESLDLEVLKFEVHGRVVVRTMALINKLRKKRAASEKAPEEGNASMEQGAMDEEGIPPESPAGEDSSSETVQQTEEPKVMGDTDEVTPTDGATPTGGAIPTEGSNEISGVEVEECAVSEDEAKKELEQILSLCYDLYVKEFQPLMYYYVTGKLLEHGLYSLTKHVIERLQVEKNLPKRLLHNVQLDYHRIQNEYAETIEVLKTMKDANILLKEKKVSSLLALFENCPNPDLKKSFQDLNLRSTCDPLSASKDEGAKTEL